jgi:hypothetical protein
MTAPLRGDEPTKSPPEMDTRRGRGHQFHADRPSSAGGGACGRIVHAVPDPAPGSLAHASWSHSWGELVPMKPCGACQPHRSAEETAGQLA